MGLIALAVLALVGQSPTLIADVSAGAGVAAVARPRAFTAIAGGVIFVAETPALGDELWFSDGTAAGTRLVRDIRPGAIGSGIQQIAVLGGIAYFAADDGSYGMELWRSDGTQAGTRLVVDLHPGTAPALGNEIVAYQGYL
jgi:ELWxxDGT repeat protein